MDIFNPVLISIVAVIAVLHVHISIMMYIIPSTVSELSVDLATVCLIVPLYEKIELLKEHWLNYGRHLVCVLTTLLCVLAMSLIFRIQS